jgi:hypothetical protein
MTTWSNKRNRFFSPLFEWHIYIHYKKSQFFLTKKSIEKTPMHVIFLPPYLIDQNAIILMIFFCWFSY